MENDAQTGRQVWLCEAIAHYTEEQYDAMLRVCDCALEAERRYAHIHHARALALIGLGRDEEAVSSLNRAFALSQNAPRYYRAWILAEKARLLRALGRAAEARRAYEKATRLSPTDRTLQAEKEETSVEEPPYPTGEDSGGEENPLIPPGLH